MFFLIAGLGNPGKSYGNTRHNLGFLVVDRLAEQEGITMTGRRFSAVSGAGSIAGRRVWLLKPMTYMNRSGESLSAAAGLGGAAGERPQKCSGGGGGGSGGAVLLESKVVTVGGAIWAHGGGGGGGGNNLGVPGGDGRDASASMTPAAGGDGRDGASCALYGAIAGGDGGAGSVGGGPGQDGQPPAENQCPDPPFPYVGGGGGGGGSGRVRINALGPCDCTGTLSPAHTSGILQGG